MGPEFFHRTRAEIDDAQKNFFEAGKILAEAFYENISTKHHRFMYHVLDHFTSFGCVRRGFTDENETLHKETKEAHKATNNHMDSIEVQLIASRLKLFLRQLNVPQTRRRTVIVMTTQYLHLQEFHQAVHFFKPLK